MRRPRWFTRDEYLAVHVSTAGAGSLLDSHWYCRQTEDALHGAEKALAEGRGRRQIVNAQNRARRASLDHLEPARVEKGLPERPAESQSSRGLADRDPDPKSSHVATTVETHLPVEGGIPGREYGLCRLHVCDEVFQRRPGGLARLAQRGPRHWQHLEHHGVGRGAVMLADEVERVQHERPAHRRRFQHSHLGAGGPPVNQGKTRKPGREIPHARHSSHCAVLGPFSNCAAGRRRDGAVCRRGSGWDSR